MGYQLELEVVYVLGVLVMGRWCGQIHVVQQLKASPWRPPRRFPWHMRTRLVDASERGWRTDER